MAEISYYQFFMLTNYYAVFFFVVISCFSMISFIFTFRSSAKEAIVEVRGG